MVTADGFVCCVMLSEKLALRLAALAVTLLFALNPNMLYLSSTPMTEPVFAASAAALLAAYGLRGNGGAASLSGYASGGCAP